MVKSFMRGSDTKPFFYNIAGEDYTLDEIKHGILRGNKRKSGHLLKSLSKADPKW